MEFEPYDGDIVPFVGIKIPGSNISSRQNNPFNLKHVGQEGSLGAGTRGFAMFPDVETGIDAGLRQLALDQSRGLTLDQFAEKYAPAYENPNWKADMVKLTGATLNTPLSQIPLPDLATAVAKRESSTDITPYLANSDWETRVHKVAWTLKKEEMVPYEGEVIPYEGEVLPMQGEMVPYTGEVVKEGVVAAPQPKIEPFDATSESLAQFSEGTGPAARIAGNIANAPFVPLEWAMKKLSQKAVRPILDLSFPKATEEEKELTTSGVAMLGSLAAAPGYLRFFGKIPAIVGEWAGTKVAPHLYESALKIPPSVPADLRTRVIQTGIEGAYLPNKATLARLEEEGRALSTKIDQMISEGTKSGKVIDTDKVLSRIDELSELHYKDMPDPRPYIAELDQAKQAIAEYRGQTIPVDVAQRMKRAIYKNLGDSYGEMKTISKEFDKSVARGIKEELEVQFPELKRLNKEWADRINLEEILERSIHRIRNYEVIRLGDVVAAGAGGAAQGSVEGAGVWFLIKRTLDSPAVKARLAVALDRANKITKSNLTQP